MGGSIAWPEKKYCSRLSNRGNWRGAVMQSDIRELVFVAR